MLKLAYNINRFYKTFGTVLDVVPTHTKLRDLKDHDFLLGVKYDIHEVLEESAYIFNEDAYDTHAWLTSIIKDINDILNNEVKPKRHTKTFISFVLMIIISLSIGYMIGRSSAISQAELLSTTDTGYFINFGHEVHEYTFE